MESLDIWRLCDDLVITQAALLSVGQDPSENWEFVDDQQFINQPSGYGAAKAAICNALRRGAIKGNLVPVIHINADGTSSPIEDSIDVLKSTVEVASLRFWLSSRGITTGFFFPAAIDEPDYAKPAHPRYAPKLAAAVAAWRAVTDPGGKSAKEALKIHLRKKASEYELCDADGNPVEQTIDEIAKIANWQPGGGAPSTPGKRKKKSGK